MRFKSICLFTCMYICSHRDDNMMLKWIDPKKHSEYLMGLNSSCESAWPISSRWCNDEGISKGKFYFFQKLNIHYKHKA